ncbi:MAG: hypothetical protein FWJ93_05630 [Micromonosporaceae bacterium]
MRTPRALVAALVLGLAVGGCGGDAPAPRTWAASVCGALAPWRTEIDTLIGHAQREMAAATTPAQAKEHLVGLLSGAEAASEAARARIADAGVPDVPDGERIARSFVEALTAARDAYRRAKATIETLPASDADAFYAEVRSALARLGEEYGRGALDTTNVRSEDLRRAFDEVPECR